VGLGVGGVGSAHNTQPQPPQTPIPNPQ